MFCMAGLLSCTHQSPKDTTSMHQAVKSRAAAAFTEIDPSEGRTPQAEYEKSRESEDESSMQDVEPTCLRPGPGSRSIIDPACIRSDVSVLPKLNRKDLGNVAIATFTIVGQAALGESNQIIRRVHPDTMEVTDTLSRRMLDAGINLVERDRRLIDAMLKELDHSTGDLIDQTSAPLIGHQLGSNTLIIGRYEFSGEFNYKTNNAGDIILTTPKKISYQSVRVKGLDIEEGKVLFDMQFSLTQKVSRVLMPKTLTAYAVRVLLERLDAGNLQ